MTSSKQASRHQLPHRSQTPDPSVTSDPRAGSISLHVDGDPDELRSFFDLSSKAASCFKPRINIIEKAESHSSSNRKTSSKRSPASLSSSSSTLSSISSSTSSTLSSGSKEGRDTKTHHNANHSSCSNSSTYLKAGNPHCSAENTGDSHSGDQLDRVSDCFQNSTYPAYTMNVFLRQMDADPSERLKPNATPRDKRASSLLKLLTSDPWKIHHIEHVEKSKVKVKGKGDGGGGGGGCGVSNRNTSKHSTGGGTPIVFYHMSPSLPLWSLRHAHHGSEHFRVVLNTPHDLWDDQIKFYSLVLGVDHDILRQDFCLFTIRKDTNVDYDIQFALKRLPSDISVDNSKNVYIQIKIKDLGKLVALLPNVCQPISDVLWETVDHSGNKVVLKVVRHRQPRRGSLCLEDAVYECMSLPIIHSLNNSHKILQQVEENSKCTQTSPAISEDSGGDDKNCNKNSNGAVVVDVRVGSGGGSGGGKDKHVNNTNLSKSTIANSIAKSGKADGNEDDCDNDDNDDGCVYENCFGVKYDDMDVYMNCDDVSRSYYRAMCNPPGSTTISALTCRVKPSPRNSAPAGCEQNGTNCDCGKDEHDNKCSNNSGHSFECVNRRSSTKKKRSEATPGNNQGVSNTVESNFTEHSDRLRHGDSNGYIVFTDIPRDGENNNSTGFPILISDEDINVEFHRSFSNGDDEACSSLPSVGKALQEDEESLTLTNLSEESGIIVLHDDDGVWCEGEGEGDIEGQGRISSHEKGRGHNEVIKPCLRKHSGTGDKSMMSSSITGCVNRNQKNYHHNSNRKVRFSDEIRSFELEPILDDSQSRLSSGFESDEQSDDGAERMLMDRKYRHRHHSHRNHHASSSSSSRTMSTEDSITSFQNGFDSLHSKSTATLSSTSEPTNFDISIGNQSKSLDSIESFRRSRGVSKTHVQKCHSDNVRSQYAVMKSCSSKIHFRDDQEHGQHQSQHPTPPGVHFRPICPPSYEVALATKRKIKQVALEKKGKTMPLHTDDSSKNDSRRQHHQHQHNPTHSQQHHNNQHHHRHHRQPQQHEPRDTVDDRCCEENSQDFEFQSHFPKDRVNVCEEEEDEEDARTNYFDLYEKSIKLHSNQRANLVCNDDVTEIHHRTRIEHNAESHRPALPTSSLKNEPITDFTVVHKRNCSPDADTQTESTSFKTQDALPKSKTQKLVGILRKSVPQKQSSSDFFNDTGDNNNNSQDITTNFTLRFDTCPMSGGQPRKEQTGFYV